MLAGPAARDGQRHEGSRRARRRRDPEDAANPDRQRSSPEFDLGLSHRSAPDRIDHVVPRGCPRDLRTSRVEDPGEERSHDRDTQRCSQRAGEWHQGSGRSHLIPADGVLRRNEERRDREPETGADERSEKETQEEADRDEDPTPGVHGADILRRRERKRRRDSLSANVLDGSVAYLGLACWMLVSVWNASESRFTACWS